MTPIPVQVRLIWDWIQWFRNSIIHILAGCDCQFVAIHTNQFSFRGLQQTKQLSYNNCLNILTFQGINHILLYHLLSLFIIRYSSATHSWWKYISWSRTNRNHCNSFILSNEQPYHPRLRYLSRDDKMELLPNSTTLLAPSCWIDNTQWWKMMLMVIEQWNEIHLSLAINVWERYFPDDNYYNISGSLQLILSCIHLCCPQMKAFDLSLTNKGSQLAFL